MPAAAERSCSFLPARLLLGRGIALERELLDAAGFDRFVEEQCRPFYAPVMGRPSLAPGRYFRLLLVGYFEGLDSERGIAWRAADSLAVRHFLGLAVDEAAPDHSTISRTRRLIAVEAHQAVFTWVQERLVEAHAAPLRPHGKELIELLEGAGQVLAEPIFADRNSPPFPRAMRDGYALRAADLMPLPAMLEVIGEIKAGAHAEDLGDSGARCGDRHGQLSFGIAHLGVDAAQVLQQGCGELAPGRLHRPRRREGLEETSGVSGGESLADAAGDQLAQHGMQPVGDLGAGAAQVPVALGPHLQHRRMIIGRDFPAEG